MTKMAIQNTKNSATICLEITPTFRVFQPTEILVSSQPSIRFFPLPARNGPFRPFFGPQGAEMEVSLLASHPEGATGSPSRVHPGKTRFGPVSGVPGPKRVLEKGRKLPKATGKNSVNGPFMHESGKLHWVKQIKFWWLRGRLPCFSSGWPQTKPQLKQTKGPSRYLR